MKIPVNVEMSTIVSDQERNEEINLKSIGALYSKGSVWFLQFKEAGEEYGEINQIIKINNQKSLLVHRHGNVSMKQAFEEGVTTEGVYQSPYGNMLMQTLTKEVKVEINELKGIGSISFTYLLHIQKDFAGEYKVEINFRRID